MNEWKSQSSHTLKKRFRSEFANCTSQRDELNPMWQARYYCFKIWSRKKAEEELDYMHMKQVRAGLVERAVDWRWSAARWYIEHKSVVLPICWPPGIEGHAHSMLIEW